MTPEVVNSLVLFSPELSLVAFLCVLFLLDAFIVKFRETQFPLILTIVASVVGMVLTCKIKNGAATPTFSGMTSSNGIVCFFRYIFFFACGASAYLTMGSKEIEARGRSEFAILLLCTTFGMCIMAGAQNLLMLYIGIETVSIISFAMAGFSRESLRSNEASFKYLVYGALASGLMIYGISLVYAYTGTLAYPEIAASLIKGGAGTGAHPTLFWLSLLLVYAGFAYKISSFPMHFWTPDVYEGAPTPVAAFFSVGPKAAGFAAIMGFVLGALATKGADGTFTPILGDTLNQMLAMVAAATMLVGNLTALGQTNTKRILAYSSIAHVGYMLMGLIGLKSAGMASVLFYLLAYCGMNLGAFWVISIVSDIKGREDLAAFKGIGWSMPVLGTCMAIFLFSLTGIPLFSGFVGKFLLFGALLQNPGYVWLALLGVLNSVVSLYYYAKILKAMWLEKPESDVPGLRLTFFHAAGLIALAVPTIVLGLFFGPVIEFAQRSIAGF